MKKITFLLRFFTSTFIFFISITAFAQPATIDSEDFEINLGIWNVGPGNDSQRRTDTPFGNAVRLKDNSGVASSMFTDDIDLTIYQSATITFEYQTNSFENVEDFFIEFSNDGGVTYPTQLGNLVHGADFNNGVVDRVSFTINTSMITFTTNTSFRIRCDANQDNDQLFIDNVLIRATINPCDPILSGNIDTDGDGISDVCDLDDDNDGILDEIECPSAFNHIANSSFEMPNTDINGAVAIIGLGGTVPLAPPLVFNDWTIVGDIDVANVTAFGPASTAAVSAFTDGDQFIDILGSGPAEGNAADPPGTLLSTIPGYTGNGIEQTLTTLIPGVAYKLSYDYTGNVANNMAGGDLFINGTFFGEAVFNEPNAFDSNTFSAIFTATGTDVIRLIASRHGGGNGAAGLLVDNFQLLEFTCNADNIDSDNIPNHLDLDSDNDGIPDLVESGGYDTDGNGIVDVLTDTDSDGIVDIYDNGSNFGILDSDNDSLDNRIDLDSDNDGISDVTEIGADDTNNNSLLDGFIDANTNGYHDPFEGLGSLSITSGDANNDGFADSYPNANSDANGLPDYLDIDSDDDGITDNIEAQTTTAFIVYDATDTDQDGIADIFDGISGFGGNALIPIDTDFDCIPDYLDINSDDDGENDNIEGHDTNGDGLINGSDTPNSDTGIFTGTDSDQDGLDDGFDNDDSIFDASNNNLNAISHPITDGLHDQDWRASNSPIDFDGVNDFIDFGDQHNITSNFTLQAWVRQTATPSSEAGIISKRDVKPGNERGYHLSINSVNQPNLAWYNDAGTKILDVTSPESITNGLWYQITASFDGTNGIIYINGEQVISSSGATSTVDNGEKFIIGGMYNSDFPCDEARNHFTGAIDEVRIWDMALSELQIREMMNQEIQNNGGAVRGRVIPKDISSGLSWTNLSGYYTMTNNVIQDESDNNINGFPKLINSTQAQTAPLPYESANDGDWDTSSTWLNGSVQSIIPGQASPFNPGIAIGWNIARITHNIEMDNSIIPEGTNNGARSLLGLIVDDTDSELTLMGTNNLTTGIGTGNGLQISHYLKLDGKIDLQGESQLIQDIDSDLDPTSTGFIEKDQQGTRDLYTYNYWSSPVGTINNSTNNNSYSFEDIYMDGSDPDNPLAITFDTAGFNGAPGVLATPSVPTPTPITIADYWIFKFADFTGGDIAGFQQVRSTGTILPGEGFTLKGVEDTGGSVELNQNYVTQGKPNNGDINLPVSATNNYLVGNPYASAIDANQFILDNAPVVDGQSAGLNGTLYFWDHFGGATHNLLDYQGGYATYSLAGGTPPAMSFSDNAVSHPGLNTTGQMGSLIPGRFIPVGQGFFVFAESDGNINFNNGQRRFVPEMIGTSVFFGIEEKDITFGVDNTSSATNDDDSTTVTNSNPLIDDRMKIRFAVNTVNQLHRQMLVTVDPNTTAGIDWGYEAPLNEAQIDDMFWVVEDGRFNIQGIDVIDNNTILPVGIFTGNDGNNSFTIDGLENVPDELEIFVHDKELDLMHNLREDGDYEFFLLAGEYLDRFELMFEDTANSTLSSDDNAIENLEVYYSNDNKNIVIVNPTFKNITDLQIVNLLGQSVYDIQNIPNDEQVEYRVKGLSIGAYILKLNTDEGTLTKKVLIN